MLADSQATLIWLTQMWPVLVISLLFLLIILFVLGKYWIFPSPRRRILRNRQRLTHVLNHYKK